MKKNILLLAIVLTYQYSFINGMKNNVDFVDCTEKKLERNICALLTYQIFLIEAGLKITCWQESLTDLLNEFSTENSSFHNMEFQKLVPNNISFTLPNLLIEELVNPSEISGDYSIVLPKGSLVYTGNYVQMQQWLAEFYMQIAPNVCTILNPTYDFTSTFKAYMPKTYYAVTQTQSLYSGDVAIRERLNIDVIDTILADEYVKKLSIQKK